MDFSGKTLVMKVKFGNENMRYARDLSYVINQMEMRIATSLVADAIYKKFSYHSKLYDDNGNCVGTFEFVDDDFDPSTL